MAVRRDLSTIFCTSLLAQALGAPASGLRGVVDVARIKADDLKPNKRYVAQYSGLSGHQLVQKCAKKIFSDANDTDYTIFEGSSNCFSQLWHDQSIVAVEEDYPIVGLDLAVDVDRNNENTRSLEEQIPWGIKAIQADLISHGPHNVTVCVVDSGIAAGHPDFRLDQIDGSDRREDGLRWDRDRAGHGSHVAGIISAASHNNVGVQGVGSFNLFIARALDDKNGGNESNMWKAVEECIDAGVEVINISLGSLSMSKKAASVYEKATEIHGITIVAAAGNSGDNRTYFPANHPAVIAVGATYETGERIPSSVKTSQLELQGPGYAVLSTGIATSAIHTPGFSYPAQHIEGTVLGGATGSLVYCTMGQICDKANEGGICLFNTADAENEGIPYEAALQRCAEGGGSGAAFFDSSLEHRITSLKVEYSMIPAITIRPDSGVELLMKLERNNTMEVTIGDSGGDEIEFTYTWGTGSSVASGHVAAGVALLKSHFHLCSSHQIRYALAATAKKYTTDTRCDDENGYGLIQLKDAYEWLLGKGDCNAWSVNSVSLGGCTTLRDGIQTARIKKIPR